MAGARTRVETPASEENVNYDEVALTRSLGMDYVSLPIAGSMGLTRENAERLAAILDQADGPVLLHCASGNRVGGLLDLTGAQAP